MSDLSEILKAIESSNKAFEEFKALNDKRFKLLEDNKGGDGDLKASMEKAFKEMSDQKAIIETLETKLKRPLLGGDGKPVDQASEEHRAAFKSYITKGAHFNQNDMQYADGLSIKSLVTTSGPDGGYAVPKVIDSMIDAIAVNISPIRNIAQVQQVSTQDFHKLIDIRGTSSGWVGETAARGSTNTPQLEDIAPPMGEVYANPQATQVQLDDVFFNAEAWLADSVATEFARAEGAAFVSGTGVAQPRGFTTYPVASTGDATRAFGTLEYQGTGSNGAFRTLSSTVNPTDDLFALVGKLKKAYRPGALWVMNKLTLFAVMAFKDYQGRYVFNPSTAPGVPDSILGYPVEEAEDMPNYATTAALAIAFGNFKRGYLIVDRIGTRVIRDPFSNKPYIGFYTTKRLGGGVTNSEAIKFLRMA
jgi:HK97 family phage major capsid protein